jgi:hypothetical protein
MTHPVARFTLGALMASFGLFGCGDSGSTVDGGTSNTIDSGTSSGGYTHMVSSEIKVGASITEANGFAFDVDGDANHRKENVLGTTLASLKSIVNVDIDMAISDALTKGEFVILHSVKASSPGTWQIYLGDPKASPDLTSGNGMFTVKAGQSASTTVKFNGVVDNSRFCKAAPCDDATYYTNGAPASGTFTLDLSLLAGSQPLSVTIIGGKLYATLTATGCMNGKIGGAITVDSLKATIIPGLADQLTARIAADGTCKTDVPPYTHCNASNQQIRTNFDKSPNDGVISKDELLNNDIIKGFLLNPDLDLLNAAGQPGTDGTPESVSIALGFSCVKAQFTVPGE